MSEWTYSETFHGLYTVYDTDGNPVAEDVTLDRAMLIAAAPNMLEVCKEVFIIINSTTHLYGLEDACDLLRAIVDEAEGEME